MNRHFVRSTLALVVLLGCEGSDFVDAGRTLSARILQGDTILLRGEATAVESRATYVFGEGLPIAVVWGAADPSIISLAPGLDGDVIITALANGSSLLVARINETFFDTITVTVTDTGAVRWRRMLAGGGAQGFDLAVDAVDGEVATTDGNGAVVVFGSVGDTAWIGTQPCFNLTGPSITSSGVFITGTQCARRFSVEGSAIWGDTIGGPDERSAVGANGDLLVLSRPALPDTVLAVSRYDPNGGLVWRDTLYTGADAIQPRGGIAVANNGDLYVAWRVGSGFLTRYSSTGIERWTVTLPGSPIETVPAVLGDDVFVAHSAGISVRDSTGAVVYDRAWAEILAGASGTSTASPPVVDPAGNLFAQATFGLFSLSPSGAVRWVADSIGRGFTYNTGPVILVGNSILVTLCGTAACGVNAATGAVVWRGPSLGSPANSGGIAVGPSGALYVKMDNELIALWHRRGMASTGWPTLGGNMGRSGMAP